MSWTPSNGYAIYLLLAALSTTATLKIIGVPINFGVFISILFTVHFLCRAIKYMIED